MPKQGRFVYAKAVAKICTLNTGEVWLVHRTEPYKEGDGCYVSEVPPGSLRSGVLLRAEYNGLETVFDAIAMPEVIQGRPAHHVPGVSQVMFQDAPMPANQVKEGR